MDPEAVVIAIYSFFSGIIVGAFLMWISR